MVSRILGTKSNAEDAIQEIMMKLWLKRNQLNNHPNIKGFVFLTARNYCIDVVRKKMKVVDNASIHLRVLESDKEHENLEWKQLNQIIKKVLENIPSQQREVFLMRDIDGCEFKEIAFALEITVEYARVLSSRARKKIGEQLEKKYHYGKSGY